MFSISLSAQWWCTVWSIILFSFSIIDLAARDEKKKAEEIVNRHLASIGTSEIRAAIQSRAISGTVKVFFRLGGQGYKEGKGNVLSEGLKIRIGMIFGATDYPAEQLAFDGNKVTVGHVNIGERSALSSFIYVHTILMKEGILSGILSTAWPLLDLPGRHGRLDYSGLKKIDGLPLHEMKYRQKGLGDLQITLYFDSETFRHVRSRYKFVAPPAMGSVPLTSDGLKDTIYALEERFENFLVVDGVTLPHTYKIIFTIEGASQTFFADWTLQVAEVVHNQTMNPRFFVVP